MSPTAPSAPQAQQMMAIPTESVPRVSEQPVEGAAMSVRGGGCVKDCCVCCLCCCAIEDICCCEIDDICC